jgi:hypothetical protein
VTASGGPPTELRDDDVDSAVDSAVTASGWSERDRRLLRMASVAPWLEVVLSVESRQGAAY